MEENKIKFIECSKCGGSGQIKRKRCANCFGYGSGVFYGNYFVFWDKKINLVNFITDKLEIFVQKTINVVLIFLGGIGLGGLFFEIWGLTAKVGLETSDLYIWKHHSLFMLLWWFSLFADMYLYYRYVHSRELKFKIPLKNYALSEEMMSKRNWRQIKQMSKKQKINIWMVFSPKTKFIIEQAWNIANKHSHRQFLPVHVLSALIDDSKIKVSFARLGVPLEKISSRVQAVFKQLSYQTGFPVIDKQTVRCFFYAYFEAYEQGREQVQASELLLGAVTEENYASDVLYDLDIDIEKLRNVVAWIHVNADLKARSLELKVNARLKPKSGMDRAMTALATPFLNRFSQDLTEEARLGSYPPCVAREKEIQMVFRILAGGTQNVILVAPQGVGTTTIIQGIAERMVAETVPAVLADKRLVSLNISALVAGAGGAGKIEQRLKQLADEIKQAGNIVLFIDHIHSMVGTHSEQTSVLDIADQLVRILSEHNFLAIATTTPTEYTKTIEKSTLPSLFSRLDMEELDKNQAIKVLFSKVGIIEYKNNVYFSYGAIEKCVDLSNRYLHDEYLPGKAIRIMEETATYCRNKKGVNSIITGEDVAQVISAKVHVPIAKVTVSESEKLLKLEEEIHKRVIGQDEAVVAVSAALRRSRAELRDKGRPIANFLFLGPTGVGKTELAKTVAAVYFGSQDNMIRVDMSEYQQKSSIARLLGQAGSQEGGILSEAVRRNPFSLVLLDELEKAHPDILNVFLQVMDDGHLTDSAGRKIDFTNTIIIATSNAGTEYIQESIKKGMSSEQIRRNLINSELKKYYRPEFLNRFDSVVVFKPLKLEEIEKIAQLLLDKVAKRLEAKGIKLQVTDFALRELAQIGFDPVFGARPLRRTIQNKVDNALAKFLLKGKLGRRDVVVLGKGGRITVKKAKKY